MSADLTSREAFWLGVGATAIGATANGLVMFLNTGYVGHNFGPAVLIAYISAAISVLMIPVLIAHIGENGRLRVAQILMMVFCSWITVEETFHQAHGWNAPEAATKLISAALGHEWASNITMMAFGAIVFIVIEHLSHLMHHGIHLVRNAHKQK